MVFTFFQSFKPHFSKFPKLYFFSIAGGILVSVPLFSRLSPVYYADASNEKTFSLFSGYKHLEVSSLKKRILGRYENRIRSYSHPYKVFQHFASQTKNGEKYMTPNDLIHSLLPYRDIPDEEQPNQLYRILKAQSAIQFFKLADTDGDGLISLEEYLHFLSFASLPEHLFASQFSKLDLDHNGVLIKDEFVYFLDTLIQSDPYLQQALGNFQRHRLTVQHCHGLLDLFFGPHQSTLSRHEFLGFMKRLKWELLRLEFYQFQVQKDQISPRDFAYSLVAYMDPSHVERYHQRIQHLQWDPTQKRVSFDEFINMDKVAMSLQNSREKFSSRTLVHKNDFRRALEHITDVPLTDSQIDVIYKVFGSNKEEVDFQLLAEVGRYRQAKGLITKMNVGLSPIISNITDTFHHAWMSVYNVIRSLVDNA